MRLGAIVSNPKVEDGEFSNLFIPGFNKVTDNSIFGIGYNFSISYFLPFYKKAKKSKADEEEPAPIEEENEN